MASEGPGGELREAFTDGQVHPSKWTTLREVRGRNGSKACIRTGYHTVEFEGFVGWDFRNKIAPHKAPRLITRGKLTFDERVVLHRADRLSAEMA